MTDYISREAAIKAVGDYEKVKIAKGLVTPEKAVVVLAGLPAADVVEVVRCKDCKYYGEHWYCEVWNNSPGFPIVDVDGYCYLAERREDE